MARLLLIFWAFSILLLGCAAQQKQPQPSEPENYIFLIPKQGESVSDIAKQRLGDPDKSHRIKEFNDLIEPDPNKPLVIPLKPLYPYGIKKTGFQTIPVLSYHAFSWKTANHLTVKEVDFEAQMLYLHEHGYHVVSVSQMLEFFNGKELPEKAVMITIDDGWGSAYRIAYPILRKYGYPYTLFIQTDLINGAYKTLDWNQIREMLKNSDLVIGSHTKTHRDLSKPKHKETFSQYMSAIKKELRLSKEIILRETGENPVLLAYPYGATNQFVIDLMKDSGYSSGFTIIREPNSIITNPMKLNRSMIYGTYNLDDFKDQLNTFKYYDLKNTQSINEIANNQPLESTARLLENNEQWLKALNHWRLIRDSLLQKANDENNRRVIQQQESYFPFFYFGTPYQEKIASAEQRIEQLESQVQAIANEHYQKGINYFSQNETLKGAREMLKTLYFNPAFLTAKTRLSEEINQSDYHIVEVKDGDTYKSLAKQVYNNASRFSLVAYYADKQGGLAPGQELRLAKLPKIKNLIPPKPVPKPKPTPPPNDCGVKSSDPKKESAKKYFIMGEKYFKKGQIHKAIKSLETSVCLNPKNKSAVELLELLKKIAH